MIPETLPFQVEQDTHDIITIRMNCEPGWEQWFLLRSDAHHDNRYCRKDIEKQHLDQARQRRAGVLDFGDCFCVMQGKFDRRLDYDQLPEDLHATQKNYFDAVVRYNAEFYEPYAANFVMFAIGNHEDSIIDRHQTNLTERLTERLRAKGSPVKTAPYQGWVRFMFSYSSTHRESYRLRYTHGYGGGGPVTKDTIQANRQMVFLDGVDFLVSAHTHDQWNVVYRREGINDCGRTYQREIECIKIGGYKDEYSSARGWAVRKGHPPKPLGGWWLRFYYANRGIRYELIRAKEG